MYEKKIKELTEQLEDEHARLEGAEEQLHEAKNLLSGNQKSMQVRLKSKRTAGCLVFRFYVQLLLLVLVLLNCILIFM